MADPTLSFPWLAAQWAQRAPGDPELLNFTREAFRAAQPDDLAAVRPLLEAMLARADDPASRPGVRRAVATLLDTARRRFFLQAFKPAHAEPWSRLLVPAMERTDFTFGELLRSREETDPRTVALRVLGPEPADLTVADVARRTRALARGMLALLGVDPAGKVAILSENRLESALCDLACLANGIVDFPLPANAVAEQIVYMLRHSGARVLLASDQEQLAKVLPALGSLPDLREVVAFDRAAAERHGLLTLEQMVGQGSGAFDDDARAERAARVRGRDLATAMYTSGTTGRPKAIAFDHLNIVSKRLCRGFALPRVGEGDVFLSYLPLYHTFGRWLELTGSLWWGATYVFARSTSRQSLLEDFRAVRPTIFISVPKKWLELHETAQLDAASDEPEVQAATLKALTGGRLRHGLSAAGYLDPQVFKAFHRAGVELCSGYGMTEATGGITMTPPGEYVEGSIGKALPGIELKRAPDGELLIRGPYVSPGYHNPGEGDVGVDAEGWFGTGDLVSVDPRGHLSIVGRKKEIYKNRMGQTIAPQRVENLFRDFDAVAQAFLVGDHREYNTLLVWPNFEGKPELRDLPPERLHALLSSLVASANGFLAPFERVVAFAVLPRALDVEHGELTAKLSFKREAVEKNHAALIETLYGEKHLTLPVDGMLLRVPKWVLREMSVLQHEVSLRDGVLSAGGRPLRVGADPAAPGALRLGDLAYAGAGAMVDLGAVLARPALWLGNEGMRAFLGGEAFLSLVSGRRKGGAELHLDLRLWPPPAPERLPRLLERVDTHEVTFLSLHAAGELLRAERPEARRAVAHLKAALQGGGEHAALAQALLRRAASAPDEEVTRLALRALLPSEAPDKLPGTLALFLDRLGHLALRDEDLALLGDRGLSDAQVEALLATLAGASIAQGALAAGQRRLLVGVMRLAGSFAASHPRWYARARVQLARLGRHPDEELAARAAEELDRLRRAFSAWIGPNLRLAIDPETGNEYGWRDVVVFEEDVPERAREILMRAIAETTLIRASVFLFGRGTLLSLADLPLRGITVGLLGAEGGKSVYRLALHTRTHDAWAVAVNLSEALHPIELRDEMDWLLAAGADPPLVEAFGGHYPDYGLFTEEYVPGEHVAAQAARLVRQGEARRLKSLWPFLAQTAFACHATFWDRTGRRIALAAPAPEAFIIPSHDYQGGARLVSVARRAPCDGLDALVDRFRAAFLAPLEARYPELAGEVDDALLLDAAVEALGEAGVQEPLARVAEGPRRALAEALLARLRAEGPTPLRIAYAVRRFQRWLEVNPGATVEARGTMLGELWRTYHLAALEKQAPETRIRFFRRTVFAGARPELAAELDRLLAQARASPVHGPDLLSELLAAHRAVVNPSPEEDYFLARMTFRTLAPADDASLVSIPAGDKQVTTVAMGLRDERGRRFVVRRPASPREIARLLQLFHDANLAVTFDAESDFLLALDGKENVIGGLFWRSLRPDRAHMDKLVVARTHRGLGVGEGLIREFMRRLRGRGVRSLGTGFFQAEYLKRYGFRTDPSSGGLVVDLDEEVAP